MYHQQHRMLPLRLLCMPPRLTRLSTLLLHTRTRRLGALPPLERVS